MLKLSILLFLVFLSFFADSGWTEENGEELFKKGIKAIEAGEYETAIQCFRETIALHPDHAASYSNMGYVYGIRGMWDEAIEAYKKAAAISPNEACIRSDFGFSLYKKQMLDEAIAEFKKAIDLNSEYVTAYHNLGVAYAEKKMFDKAIPMFQKALEITPNDPASHFNLGKVYKELGKHALAAEYYYQAGILYLKEGYREGALTAYENILPCSKEIADILLKKLYPDKEASDLQVPSPPKKEDHWYVLTYRMNVRKDPYIPSKILGQLDKGAEFQILKEGPNNTPLYSWYLIRTKSGFSGWVCGIHKGIVKYKPVSKPNVPALPPSSSVSYRKFTYLNSSM